MRPGSIKARVLGKGGFGPEAGPKSIWQWLTGHAFTWQFTLQFTLVFALLSLVLVSLTGLGLSSYLPAPSRGVRSMMRSSRPRSTSLDSSWFTYRPNRLSHP